MVRAAVAALLAFKLLLSLPRRRQRPALWPGKPRITVAAIITVYNEDPDTLRSCLDSLFAQSRPPDAITIVDDASSDRRAVEVAHMYEGLFHLVGVDYAVVEFTQNKGKRHGLAAGFERSPDVDVYMCVDSDTVLVPEATDEALRPFASRRVHCVTGLVLALNRGTNY